MRKTIKKSLALVLSLLMLISVSQLGFATDPDECTHEGLTPSYTLFKNDDGTFQLHGYAYCSICKLLADETKTAELKVGMSQKATCSQDGFNLYEAKFTNEILNAAGDTSYYYHETIAALGHDFSGDINKLNNGTHNWKCIRCDANGKMENGAPVVNGTVACSSTGDNVATCTEKATCDVCGAKYGETAKHTLTKVPEVKPTCLAAGNIEYWKCSECGKYFSDAEGNTEITDKTTVNKDKMSEDGKHTPKETYSRFAEDGSAYDCTKAGYKVILCDVCGVELEDRIPLVAGGHTQAEGWRYIGKNGADYDCTVGGQKVKYCEICGKELGERENVAAMSDHSYFQYPAVPATCTEGGWTAYRACTVCGKQTSQPQPTAPTGHTKVHVEAKAATCSEPGNEEYWKCSVCGLISRNEDFNVEGAIVTDDYKYDEEGNQVLDEEGKPVVEKSALEKVTTKKDHTFELLSATVEPECIKNGKKAIYKCSVCGQLAVLAEQKDGKYEEGAYSVVEDETEVFYKNVVTAADTTIKMLGHNWDKDIGGNGYVAPTCTQEGSCKAFCIRCGIQETLPLEKVPHTPDTSFESKHFDPTCERGAYETRKCTVCKQEYEEDLYDPELPDSIQADVKPLGHNWSGLVTTIQEASCTQKGIKGRACLNGCGKYLDGVESDMLPHQLEDVRVEPEGHTSGYTGKKCKTCGQIFDKKDITVPAECVDANKDAKCDICGKILCDHICHDENGFKKIVWFFMRVWYQFLGINETCKCGLPHYTKAGSVVVPD